jgi:aspartyl-tRNA(Asn)/glutamyl-tRNA(Gln) amidotransferase subunit A
MSGETLAQLSAELASGRLTSRGLLETHLGRIDDPAGEGARAFIRLDRAAAIAMADAQDRLRREGRAASPLAGLAISIKDLFDVAGEVTTGGSVVLKNRPPAAADCDVVARLRAAGAIPFGRTNMTEFAFSGIGWNPHYGTPLNPYDRAARRVPGGSTSGGAVALADFMCAASLGSDTGGSTRLPAALCGLVGFKPTQRRIPRDGVLPLSTTLDSIGPIARSVACCALIDAVIAGEPARVPEKLPLAGRRFLVPRNYVLDELDNWVATAFERALERLAAAGAVLTEATVAPLDDLTEINRLGSFSAPEAAYHHRAALALPGAPIDHRVRLRIERASGMTAVQYVELGARRRLFQRAMLAAMQDYDAMLMPTSAITAPRVEEIIEDQDFFRLNALVLRNTSAINFLDGCALSVPCHLPGEPPVGLMLAGAPLADSRIFALGQSIETALAR